MRAWAMTDTKFPTRPPGYHISQMNMLMVLLSVKNLSRTNGS